MPRTEIIIGGESWELKPLKGLKAMKAMPKIIGIAAEVLWAAQDSGFRIDQILLESDTEVKFDLGTALRAMKLVSDVVGERFDEIAADIMPLLLQKPYGWLWENGQINEILKAMWVAIKFHIETSFGSEVIEALKKSMTAPPEEEVAAETSSTPNEVSP